MADQKKAQVIPFPETVEIRTLAQAVRLLDAWRLQAQKMEMLYEIAGIQRDMSEALLKDALTECARLRGLIK